MTKREFIDEIRAFADDIEKGDFHFTKLGNDNGTIFGNRNYGQVWVKLNDVCTINVDLYHATDEEKQDD